MTAIERAIEHAGGQAKLAKECGIAPQYLHQIAKGERPVSTRLAAAIEAATGGAVTRLELLYPDENPGPPAAPTEQGAAA